MIIKKCLLCLILVTVCWASSETCLSESRMNNEQNNLVSFDDFEWLVGFWEGEAFGGHFEEVWLPESGGSMSGIFKLITNDSVSFYEIFTITFDSTDPVLRVKHFNADLTGWEEKDEVVTFPFISAGDGEIRFDGLTYRKRSDKTMQIILKIKNSDGKVTENIIDCQKR